MHQQNITDLPDQLAQLHQPPKCLYAIGNKDLLKSSMPKVAVVGSRRVSLYGNQVTSDLAGQLGRWGVIVVSGLALGVDGLAHRACLDAGGRTIAVLPSSLDKIYPASNSALARSIIDNNGLLLSEYEQLDYVQNHQFIERNRIIAGISDALLITEAAAASGSLHTARFALELGMTVMAVPGPITSPLSRGTNNLIRMGAVPITKAEDILEAIGYMPTDHNENSVAYNDEERAILSELRANVTDESLLLMRSALSPPVFFQTLTMLEIQGRIRLLAPGHWTLV